MKTFTISTETQSRKPFTERLLDFYRTPEHAVIETFAPVRLIHHGIIQALQSVPPLFRISDFVIDKKIEFCLDARGSNGDNLTVNFDNFTNDEERALKVW